MNSEALRQARLTKKWTQAQAAKVLGVTQAYLSMLENGQRPVSRRFARKALKVLHLPPTALPLRSNEVVSQKQDFALQLGALGYPGFAYLPRRKQQNPAEVLFEALGQANLDSRVAEGLPWLALNYVDMDWNWLVRNVKLHDRQNRLGFAVALANEVAVAKQDSQRVEKLQSCLEKLEKARLVREDTFCHDSMTQAERAWLRDRRSPTAAHWNLLTDMQ